MNMKKWLENGSLSSRDGGKYLEKITTKKHREELMKFIKNNGIEYFSSRELSEKSGAPTSAVRSLVRDGLAVRCGAGVYRILKKA